MLKGPRPGVGRVHGELLLLLSLLGSGGGGVFACRLRLL